MQIKILFSILFFLLLIIIPSGCSEPKKSITKVTDAEHAVIGAMTGTTGEQLVKRRFPKAIVKSFDDIMDAVVALKSNQLDAVITGFPAAMNVSKHNAELYYLEEPVEYENTSIAVMKGNKDLLENINEFIDSLDADGTLKDMRRRWFKTSPGPYEEVEIKTPLKGEVLKIGTSATREPFCFVDAKGEVNGHDGELARRIGAELGRPVEFFDMKFAALIPALQSGKIDLICAGMTATEERSKSVDFTRSYFQNSQVLLVKKPEEESTTEVKLNLKSKEDVKDKRIGVILGTVHDQYAMKEFKNATLLQFKTTSELLLAVRNGKVDAAIYTTEALPIMLKNDEELSIFGDTLFAVPVGMGFKKDNDELRFKFNKFLQELKGSGLFDGMVERWIINGETTMPEIINTGDQGIISIGTVGDKGLPFTAIVDNRMVGFDVELCERFAASLGKQVHWIDMEFGSLIISLSTNKMDMIASTLMITKERMEKIDFSDPYYTLGASLVAHRKNIAQYNNEEVKGRRLSFFQKFQESFSINIIKENRYLLILEGLKTTVIVSILATLLGTFLGAIICWMRMSKARVICVIAKFYISLLRGIPVLVLLLIIFYIAFASVDINPVLVSVIAFGLNFAAYVSEMFRTGIQSIDSGQSEAGIAMGFTKIKTFRFIILPQALKRILPVYKGEVITLVKMTSIVGYIAVQDLTKASDIIRGRTFDAFFPLIMVAILYFIISWLFILLLNYLEKRTDPRMRDTVKISLHV